ncbi:TPA: hypothetical protein HA265_06390, partial [Candidatus Woesearchaeota archaeon]|nr:hypothetical protein [Candidatus Woesearchaeota archaeon]
ERYIDRALAFDRPEYLPVKAVNVFDERFAGLFNGHRPVRGTAPGKGAAMYLGMAVATGDVLLFLDTDFKNIDDSFVLGLLGPFENPRTVLSKATFDLEDLFEDVVEDCLREGRPVEDEPLLMKSVISRTLARPMTGILDESLGVFPGMSRFRGPLSGGCGAPKEVWHSLMIPTHYGIEVSYLMQLVRMFPAQALAYDVNLGAVVQESQDEKGWMNMAGNIFSTIVHHLRHFSPDIYERMKDDPGLMVDEYLRRAGNIAIHRSDAGRIKVHAGILEKTLSDEEALNNGVILPALERNVYMKERGNMLRYLAADSSAHRIINIKEGSRRYSHPTLRSLGIGIDQIYG